MPIYPHLEAKRLADVRPGELVWARHGRQSLLGIVAAVNVGLPEPLPVVIALTPLQESNDPPVLIQTQHLDAEVLSHGPDFELEAICLPGTVDVGGHNFGTTPGTLVVSDATRWLQLPWMGDLPQRRLFVNIETWMGSNIAPPQHRLSIVTRWAVRPSPRAAMDRAPALVEFQRA